MLDWSAITNIIMQLAHYGLPAIGIIMIAMLRKSTEFDVLQEARVIRDLGIIVTEVDLGTIVRPMEPNYALLSRAADAIKKFLERFHAPGRQIVSMQGRYSPQSRTAEGLWSSETQLEPWDFEINFWDNLAEHPSMFHPILE